jgi:L-2-hydroxyglutarate oxidase
MEQVDVVIIGGGIVGLATAHRLLEARPDLTVRVVERESAVGLRQSSRNSGVLHSGIYYQPGSAKARWSTAGKIQMEQFCAENDVPVVHTGKVVAAVEPEEVPFLQVLLERGRSNGVEVHEMSAAETAEREPHLRALGALFVPRTAVTDFGMVCRALERRITEAGGTVTTGVEMTGLVPTGTSVRVGTTAGDLEARTVVTCTGLRSDRTARLTGDGGPERIVPFRGSWLELRPERRYLVNGNIYPVPRPGLTFLGVHLTRKIDGSVWIGPNAVVALAREGRRPWSIDLRDLRDTLSFRGVYRLGMKHPNVAFGEVYRDVMLRATIKKVQRYVPEITVDDVERGPWGVRAQLIDRDGEMVNDFRIKQSGRLIHVVNAPSPAATASLQIGAELRDNVLAAL